MRTRRRYIETVWRPATYDVWGNAREGYDVNDVFRGAPVTLRLRVEIHNIGTPQEFESAYPSDKQIREALDIKPRVRLSLDGDALAIYVTHESTGYPLGELTCVSHESLSPIRAKEWRPTQ